MTNLVMNDQFNGVELYFDTKPLAQIITTLKSNKFRWNGKKMCWYAKQSEQTIKAAELIANEKADQVAQHVTETPQKTTKKQELSLWSLTRFDNSTSNVNKELSTKEIASDVRKAVRKRFKMCKFSLTSTYNSISFYIVSSPFEKDSTYLLAIKEYCQELIRSYCYTSVYDPYGDYGSTPSFYGARCEIDYQYTTTDVTEDIKKMMSDFDEKLKAFEVAEQKRKEIEYQQREIERAAEQEKNQKIQERQQREVEEIVNTVTATELKETDQYFVIGAQYSNINKLDKLTQYKKYVNDSDYYINNMKVTKEIHFANVETLNNFSNLLLHDFDFLEKEGGSYTDDLRVNSMTDYSNMSKEERATVVFNLYGVAIYFENELQFVIDPQGYSYARYVGLIGPETTTTKVHIPLQHVTAEQIESSKIKAESLEDYSFNVIANNNLVKTWSSEKWNTYKDLLKKELKANDFKLTKAIIQQLPEDQQALKGAMYRVLTEVDGIQEQFTNVTEGQKITMYSIGGMGGMNEQRVTVHEIINTEYAQYDNAVKVTFTPQGKRKQYYNYFHGKMLIFNGWVTLPTEVLNTIKVKDQCTITSSKFMSCDHGQFDAILNHYSSAEGIKPIVNTYKPEL